MKKLSLNAIAFVVSIVLGLTTSMAASKHVSPKGSDSNPGTLAEPWQTISLAGLAAVAGDTVYIHGGTYNDRLVVKKFGD
ncbi:MAG: hypothetical protein HC896_17615 [Bacteroidales bacterium]|nr:hypothetical protein [Bacteroidales bacterium]